MWGVMMSDKLMPPNVCQGETLGVCCTVDLHHVDCSERYTLKSIQDTRTFEGGATRDTAEGKLDYEGFLSPVVLRRFAEYMHAYRTRNVPEGDELRASDNWQKGIPRDVYMKSLLRHVMELWEQHRTWSVETDTLCAIMFNVMGYLFEVESMEDVPEDIRNHRFAQEIPEGRRIIEEDIPGVVKRALAIGEETADEPEA